MCARACACVHVHVHVQVDGYAVTYTAGATWKFLLGFDPDGGLTMYHLRYVLPPSKAHPNGNV